MPLMVTIEVNNDAVKRVEGMGRKALKRDLTAEEVIDFIKTDVEWWLDEEVEAAFAGHQLQDSIDGWARRVEEEEERKKKEEEDEATGRLCS